MKNTFFCFILLFISGSSFGQIDVFEPNQDSILYYFTKLVNDARVRDEYTPIKINNRIKNFTEEAVNHMLEKYPNNPYESCYRLFQGNADAYTEYMTERWGTDNLYWFENTGVYKILYKGEYSKLKNIRKDNAEYFKGYEEMVKYGPSNKIFAKIIFVDWMYNITSYSYTQNLIHPLAKGFYLAVGNAGDRIYVDYLSLNLVN